MVKAKSIFSYAFRTVENFRCMKKSVFLLFFVFMYSFASHAQMDVSGRVINAEDDQPIPGVTVIQKGTNNGTITDTGGKFSLKVPQGSTLVFSFVGMRAEEITVQNEEPLQVVLIPALEELDEVVVIGYGTKKKRDIIGAVSSVTSEELSNTNEINLTNALQGKAAGIQITSSSGVPGANSSILIRGQNSLNLDTEPLIVVDGMPIYSGSGLEETKGSTKQDPMSLINLNDVESIEVLKDAAATAIYGSRGSNGVILITTKSGKKGGGSTNVDYRYGIMELSTKPEDIGFTNTQEWFSLVDTARSNSGLTPFTPQDIIKFFRDEPLLTLSRDQAKAVNTDWFDQILQTGAYQELNVSSSRGGEDGRFYLSLNYYDLQRSVLKQNYFNRFSGRANFDFEPFDNLMVGARLNFAYTNNSRVQQQVGGATGNSSGGQNAGFGNANRNALPWFPIYSNVHPSGYWNPMSGSNLIASIDPDNYFNDVTNYRGLGGVFAEYRIPFIEGLTIRSEGSFDFIQNNSIFWVNEYLREEGSFATDRAVTRKSFNFNAYGNYNQTFAEVHNIAATFGIEGQTIHSFLRQMEGQNLNGTYKELGNPSDYLEMRARLENEEYLLGYIGRLDYKLMDKYIIGLSLRRDGSSKFPQDYRWGLFTAYSAGWIISEESFFQNINAINFLKLRGSFGKSGNNNIPSDRFVTTYTNNRGDRYGDANLISGGSRISNIGTPTLTWETTNNREVGIDYGFLENRISGTIAYYEQEVNDLLLRAELPPSAGVGHVWDNIGDMINKGFEFDISSVNVHNPMNTFKWTTTFNISTNQNEILKLTPSYDDQGLGVTSGNTISVTGGRLWAWYVNEYAGVDPERGVDLIHEIDYQRWQQTGETVKTGRMIPATNTNLNRNRIIMQDKPRDPTYYGGINNTFEYKGIDLSIFLSFAGGHYIYDYEEQRTSYVQYGQVVLRDDLIGNTWEKPGDQADFPMLTWDMQYRWGWDHEAENPDWNGEPDDRRAKGVWLDGNETNQTYTYNNEGGFYDKFLYKADYLRLRTLQVGYTFSSALTSRLKLKTLRLYFTANNLLTFTNYPGWDPETGAGVVPPLRMYNFGININF